MKGGESSENMRIIRGFGVDFITTRGHRVGSNRPNGVIYVVSHVPIEIVPTPFARIWNTSITAIVRVTVPSSHVGISFDDGGVSKTPLYVTRQPVKMTRTIKRTIFGGERTITLIGSRNQGPIRMFLILNSHTKRQKKKKGNACPGCGVHFEFKTGPKGSFRRNSKENKKINRSS